MLERNRRVAKAYARAPVVTVNGSEEGFDGFRIGNISCCIYLAVILTQPFFKQVKACQGEVYKSWVAGCREVSKSSLCGNWAHGKPKISQPSKQPKFPIQWGRKRGGVHLSLGSHFPLLGAGLLLDLIDGCWDASKWWRGGGLRRWVFSEMVWRECVLCTYCKGMGMAGKDGGWGYLELSEMDRKDGRWGRPGWG